MSRRSFDYIIVGGGIIGCALARTLSAQRQRVLLLEKELSVALHTSGRNSGVVHSGFNAKPGTLKARFCVEGNDAIRQYVQSRDIPFEAVGTYVVATEEHELSVLKELKKRGDSNGVPHLQLLPIKEVEKREPNVKGLMALFAPTGGIIDARVLAVSLAQEAVQSGATVTYWQEVQKVHEQATSIDVITTDNRYSAGFLINAAGLFADRLAHGMGVGTEYMILPFRGSYCTIQRQGTPIINSMIYPVPDLALPFLGVHLTKTVHDTILVGPNAVPAFGREAYQGGGMQIAGLMEWARHPAVWKAFIKNRNLMNLAWQELGRSISKRRFWEGANRLVRGLTQEHLISGRRAGIRPQLIRSDGQLVDDLVIESTSRTVHILNVVSPGMTSALAFAKWLADRLERKHLG